MKELLKVVFLSKIMVTKTNKKEENIWNIPNFLTLTRVIIAFITIYFVFAGFSFLIIAISFTIGMITDFLDGQIARRFKLVTEFGRKFDMIADRLLMIGTVVAIIIDMGLNGDVSNWFGFQILIVMSREIISFPFALIAFTSGKKIPHARFIGKLTTFLQAIALPLILINVIYPELNFSIYFAVVTSVVGIFSAITYINDLHSLGLGKEDN